MAISAPYERREALLTCDFSEAALPSVLEEGARIPVSTYRLQFNYQFRFSDAQNIIPYLFDLGISDIYASPYFKAQPGSLHGYDIVDPNVLNSEIGTEEEYNGMVRELDAYGMGQMLDIVPNHMCITNKENTWWMDILENGTSSLYAGFFDINWNPVKKELTDKVLLPFLGDQYGRVLERQEITLLFEQGMFSIRYYGFEFPVTPKTYALVLNHRIRELQDMLPENHEGLTELLSIITALDYLPSDRERDPERIEERYREKEIIKKRLWNLCKQSKEISMFIEENVRLYNGVKGETSSFDLLDRLLNEQPYRLAHWRVATDEINYRRFFDINHMAALRMETLRAFNAVHPLILRLVGEGKVTGLRVDHPDGLYNPSGYFHWLQKECFLSRCNAVAGGRELGEQYYSKILEADPQYKTLYIVGEKILTKGERMPDDWPIFSTTGYVFMNSLNGIFVDTDNAGAFDDIYSRFIRTKMHFPDIVYEKKKLIMQVSMSSEINTLGHYLSEISEKNRHTRDFTLNSLIAAIIEVIAFFPVYRTYTSTASVSDTDRKYIELAIAKARRKNPAVSEYIYDFLKEVLLLRCPSYLCNAEMTDWLAFVTKFQQLTGPVMAKGLEDTAFYLYNRLVSLNEVGGSPDRFGIPLETFHGQNRERIKFWPHALIASSTHDSKRSEDVRTRIDVLSEIPDEWRQRLIGWRRLNKKKKRMVEGAPAPGANEEYFYYQTLIGAWPAEGTGDEEEDIFKKRIQEYMLKALREGKVNSSWINPNTAYEDAVMGFIEETLRRSDENEFLKDFVPFQKKISLFGMYNSLSQVLLKITSPGVPDFYQGTELWNFALVDPDNRRPVDYERRKSLLGRIKSLEAGLPRHELARQLVADMNDGTIKLYLTYRALNYRRENKHLFKRGEYIPLQTSGGQIRHVCSYARRLNSTAAVVVATRFFCSLIDMETMPLGKVWKSTYINLPDNGMQGGYRNVITGEIIESEEFEGQAALALSRVLMSFPVALLEKI